MSLYPKHTKHYTCTIGEILKSVFIHIFCGSFIPSHMFSIANLKQKTLRTPLLLFRPK